MRMWRVAISVCHNSRIRVRRAELTSRWGPVTQGVNQSPIHDSLRAIPVPCGRKATLRRDAVECVANDYRQFIDSEMANYLGSCHCTSQRNNSTLHAKMVQV